MAAYVLSDARIIEALSDAADRGVAVRLYLDRSEFESHAAGLDDAARAASGLRPEEAVGVLMHMKAYAVDRARLRTGSGNFSRSGLSRQDNDLLVTDDASTVGRFERDFRDIFAERRAAPGRRHGFCNAEKSQWRRARPVV